MAAPKRTRTASSTPRTKKASTTSAQENAALQQTPTNGNHSNGNVEELVRFRAYQLFEQRGRVHGYDVEDWLRATAEVVTGAQHSA